MLVLIVKTETPRSRTRPLHLHSNFRDQVVVNIVEKDNNHFLNQSQNSKCVVIITLYKLRFFVNIKL